MNQPDAPESFLAEYDPRAYDPVAVTVDVVALTIRESRLQVLLIRRGEAPFQGRWGLPGGFGRPGAAPRCGGRGRRPAGFSPPGMTAAGERADEDLPATAARELAEEAGPALR